MTENIPDTSELVYDLRDAIGDNFDHGATRYPNHTLWFEDKLVDAVNWDSAAESLLRDGWAKRGYINTIAGADALPDGSVILSGGVASIALTHVDHPVRVWDSGHGAQCTSHSLVFPAFVLHTGEVR